MKVVLFCGGMGLRIRDYSDEVPKPMIPIGNHPILWHIMKYYAHYGHKEFVLCLGYQANKVKEYFLNYSECYSNDFVLTGGGSDVDLLSTDIHDWRITFVDTGLNSNIGQRLMRVREHLSGEEVFLANYADGVTDLSLPPMIDEFRKSGRVGCFLATPPNYTFHVVDADEEGTVSDVVSARDSGLWTNAGFFVLRQEIFDFMEYGDELVEAPFRRLIDRGELGVYRHSGFWACMDTFKEKELLDRLHATGNAPWEVWRTPNGVADDKRAAVSEKIKNS